MSSTPSQTPKPPHSVLALPPNDQKSSFSPRPLPPAASKSSATAVVAKRAEALRRSLSEFYTAVHPARIGSVAGIVQVFEAHGATVGELRDLNAELREQYGCDLISYTDPAEQRKRWLQAKIQGQSNYKSEPPLRSTMHGDVTKSARAAARRTSFLQQSQQQGNSLGIDNFKDLYYDSQSCGTHETTRELQNQMLGARGIKRHTIREDYQLGIFVSDGPPHIISNTVGMIGCDGLPLEHQIRNGDELLAINDTEIINSNSKQLMMGEEGSVAKVTLRRKGDKFSSPEVLYVARLVPAWLVRMSDVVSDLHAMRVAFDDLHNVALMPKTADIMADSVNDYGLGMTIEAHHARNEYASSFTDTTPVLKVTMVAQGSPSHMAGIEIGDTVLKVDGMDASLEKLLHHEKDSTGVQSVLVCCRNGRTFECTVTRARTSRIHLTDALLDLLESARTTVIKMAEMQYADSAVSNIKSAREANSLEYQLLELFHVIEKHVYALAADDQAAETFTARKMETARESFQVHVSDCQRKLSRVPSVQDLWDGFSQNAARKIENAKQLATALAESQTARQELVGARAQISDLTAKLKNLEIEHEVLRGRKTQLDEDTFALQQQVKYQKIELQEHHDAARQDRAKELQDEVFSLRRDIKRLQVENDDYQARWRSDSNRLPKMDILEKKNLELQKQIESLKTRSSRVACIERFCNLLGDDADKQPVAPDAMVDAFKRCDLRVDQVMRLFDVLARQNLDRGGGGWVVDEVEEIYDFLNRENTSFFNLIERFRSMASLETRLESAQNQTTEAHRMLTQEKRIRARKEEEVDECKAMVQASADALEEWLPLKLALQRHPPVGPGEMAAALTRSPSPPRHIIELLDCLTQNKAEVPDVLQILNILWLDEGMSVESIQKAVCRISSIQAQRFRYKHLDPTSHAGRLAGLIRANQHCKQNVELPELPEDTLLARLANMEHQRSTTTYLQSQSGQVRRAQVMAFQAKVATIDERQSRASGVTDMARGKSALQPGSEPT